MLKENNTVLYLGLAGLKLTIEDLTSLLIEFGKAEITIEEYDAIQLKTKERDAIIEKNKKSNKKKQEIVPFVQTTMQDEKGNSFVIKHENFKHLNLALNELDDSAEEELDKLMERTPQKFLLTITDNPISTEVTDKLKEKYGARIIL